VGGHPLVDRGPSPAGSPRAVGLGREAREGLLKRLRRDAELITGAFGLSYRDIGAARADARSFYGLCDEEGRIRIRLNHVTTGRPLRYSSLINTLCHELAHLRHFHHGPAFRSFYRQILEWAREQGIYRPATSGPRAGPAEEEPVLSPEEVRASLEELRSFLSGRPSDRDSERRAEPAQLSLFGDGG
jgi:hypothetical protein